MARFPDLARSGVFFFFLKKKISQIPRSGQIWPDLETRSPHLENEPDLGNWPPNLARSGSIRVFWSISFFFQRGDPLVAEIPQPNLVAKSADFSKISKKKKKKNFFFFFTSVFEACSLHPRYPSETKKSKKA